MKWEEVVKLESKQFGLDLREYIGSYQDLVNHPDYVPLLEEQFRDFLSTSIFGKEFPTITFKLFEAVSTGRINLRSTSLDIRNIIEEGNYNTSLAPFQYLGMGTEGLRFIYKKLGVSRSIRLLEHFAYSIGVEIDIGHSNRSVKFNAHGLGFRMSKNRLKISTKPLGDDDNHFNINTITLCIVDENRLPIGDFFASLLGLVVLQPNKLDVLEFAIAYTKILQRNVSEIERLKIGMSIDVYSPFTKSNNENHQLTSVIEDLHNRSRSLIRTPLGVEAKNLLSEIEDALRESFGSGQGWF